MPPEGARARRRLLSRRSSPDQVSSARSGLIWTASTRLVSQVLQVAGVAVTARFLSPDEYGLAVLAVTLSVLAGFLSELGVAAAVVNRGAARDQNFLSTSFWVCALTGVAAAGLLGGISGVVASFYGDQRLAPLVLLASVTFLVTQSAVPTGILMVEHRFRSLAVFDLASGSSAILVSSVAAVLGAGPACLIYGQIVGATLQTALVSRAAGWHPSFVFHKKHALELWRFVRGLLGYDLAGFIASNVDRLVLPRLINAASFGYFTRASSLINIPANQLAAIGYRILYPVITARRNNLADAQGTYLKAARLGVTASAALIIFLVSMGDLVVEVLLGAAWQRSTTPLMILAGTLPFIVLRSLTQPVLQAWSQTGKLFAISVAQLAIVGLGVAASAPFGLVAVAYGFLVSQIICATISIRAALAQLSIAVSRLGRNMARPASYGLVATVGAIGWRHIGPEFGAPIFTLLFYGVSTLLMIAFFVVLFDRQFIKSLLLRP